jgi:hypothetical protein
MGQELMWPVTFTLLQDSAVVVGSGVATRGGRRHDNDANATFDYLDVFRNRRCGRQSDRGRTATFKPDGTHRPFRATLQLQCRKPYSSSR